MLCFCPPGIALSNNRHNTFSRVKNTKPSGPRPPKFFGRGQMILWPPSSNIGGGAMAPSPPVPTPLHLHITVLGWPFGTLGPSVCSQPKFRTIALTFTTTWYMAELEIEGFQLRIPPVDFSLKSGPLLTIPRMYGPTKLTALTYGTCMGLPNLPLLLMGLVWAYQTYRSYLWDLYGPTKLTALTYGTCMGLPNLPLLLMGLGGWGSVVTGLREQRDSLNASLLTGS